MTNLLTEEIKVKLLAKWLPDRPGGLKGLVELAAEVASDAIAEGVDCGHVPEMEHLKARVEFLTEALHFAEATQVTEEGEGDDVLVKAGLGFDSYSCTQCHPTNHKVDSAIGQEHLSAYLREQVEANVEPVAPNERG